MCHLDVMALRGRDVGCATCGARGVLVVESGDVSVRFDDAGVKTSVISMDEKREHFFEIQETAKRHAGLRDEIESRAGAYADFDRIARPERVAR
jgi:hypothetical protein